MRVVRWFLGLAAVATLAWGGLWFLAVRGLDAALDQALSAPGTPLTADARAVRGFPNRLDITLTRPHLNSDGLIWTAPFLQVFSLVYRPHHVIVVVANEQSLSLDGLPVAITTEDARASLVMRPGSNLVLDRAVLVARMPVMALPGERLSADAARAALRLAEGEIRRYEAVIEIEAAFPDPEVMAGIDPEGLLPRRWDILRLEAELVLDRPLDLEILRGAPLPAVELVLTGARVAAEGVDLRATGRIAPDVRGRPTGELVVSVTGWPVLSERLVAAGLLAPEALAWVQATAAGLARPEAPEILDIPLRLAEGQLRLGPLVLAELPAL